MKPKYNIGDKVYDVYEYSRTIEFCIQTIEEVIITKNAIYYATDKNGKILENRLLNLSEALAKFEYLLEKFAK